MIKFTLISIFLPLMAFAQEHGHSHGAGGEGEHLYPILAIMGVLIAVGAYIFFSNKKNN